MSPPSARAISSKVGLRNELLPYILFFASQGVAPDAASRRGDVFGQRAGCLVGDRPLLLCCSATLTGPVCVLRVSPFGLTASSIASRVRTGTRLSRPTLSVGRSPLLAAW